MSYKPLIVFAIIFGIIIFIYFNYELFLKYFPIHIGIKIFILIVGILGIFFPEVIRMLRNGIDTDKIKEFIIDKYKKK